ncbi:MAG: class I SAM-dependent methyltransferase [Williamsia sp.]|nr:class I SAM-dependent methyltransferase [Williamsia sp.]
MQVQQAYNQWAAQYDTNENKTRDLEGIALRTLLDPIPFTNCLEIGCGTGKNSQWLVQKAEQLTSVDFSEEMLAKARKKLASDNVAFVQADIKQTWTFAKGLYDLVCFSLVLEHIEDLGPIFREAARVLLPGGWVYVGELHPFKQYQGTRARFDTPGGLQVVECYNHHVSEFVQAARKAGLLLADLNEYFDDPGSTGMPRILTLLFKKKDV